jgi:hypothetical protein
MSVIGNLTVSESYHQLYKDTEYPYGQLVRDRLRYLLAYEPALVHSIYVEMMMRRHLSVDPTACSGKVTDFDFKAIVALRYREVLCTQGVEAANNSPLIGLDLEVIFKDYI